MITDPLKLYSLVINIRSAIEIKIDQEKSKINKISLVVLLSNIDQYASKLKNILDINDGELDE